MGPPWGTFCQITLTSCSKDWDQTAHLWSQSDGEINQSSLTSSAEYHWFRRISLFIFELAKSEVIFVHQNLISNRLTYRVHAKSTDELISFGFCDRSVRSSVSAKRCSESLRPNEKRLHFMADLWSQNSSKVSAKDWSKKWNDPVCLKQEVKVIWQKAPHGGPIPRLGVTPGGRKLYHWIPGVGFPISVP